MIDTLAFSTHGVLTTGMPVDGPIVLATKPFDTTPAPLAMARWLAHREDRELHMVSVCEDEIDAMAMSSGAPVLPQRYYEEERSAVAERMRTEFLQLDDHDITCHIDVECGPSARTIVDIARDRDARMIVIGTGRHDPLGRLLYGERAMQIVRLADRPVLIVPRDAVAGAIRRVVVAVDFSRSSLRAARAAIPMISFGGEMILVHVRPSEPDARINSRSSAMQAHCDEMFARFVGFLSLVPGLNVSTRVLWGDPVEAIDLHAQSIAADLLVCGRLQKHTLAERVFIGSTSAGLLRRTHCPILIAPESADDARADVREPLSGIASWERGTWCENLEAFAERNTGRRVRLSSEVEGEHAPRCVAQNYLLRSISLSHYGRLRLVMADVELGGGYLAIGFDGLEALTVRTDRAGPDTHLEFRFAGGRGTLTLNPSELP